MFTLGLIVHSALEIIARSFYADKDTLTPLFAALGGALINFVLAFALSDVARVDSNALLNAIALSAPSLQLSRDFGNVSGLALANSLGVMFEVLALLFFLRRRWRGIAENALARTLLKTLIASLVMAAAIVAADLAWESLVLGSGLSLTILRLLITGALGLAAFLLSALLLKMQELPEIVKIIRLRPAN